MPDELPPSCTVHCFFGACGHIEQAADPIVAHDRMEDHYTIRHQDELDLLVCAATTRRLRLARRWDGIGRSR